jgi:hypothetical protein
MNDAQHDPDFYVGKAMDCLVTVGKKGNHTNDRSMYIRSQSQSHPTSTNTTENSQDQTPKQSEV